MMISLLGCALSFLNHSMTRDWPERRLCRLICGSTGLDLHDDLAGSHRVGMQVGVEIGKAAGGE